jgi:hypothetical protein
MKNKIIKEVNRVNKLMGNENILSESPNPGTVVKYLKKLFNLLDDDVARKVIKATDNSQDDLIRRLRAGETLSDDVMELLLKVIDFDLLAKNLVDKNLLGSRLSANIEKIITTLKENPGRYDELVKRMDDAIEKLGTDSEIPIELIDSLKKDVKGRIDDAIENVSKAADDIDISDIIGQISKEASNINNIDDFGVSLKEFLTKNRDRLTPMFTSKDINRYVEEITGQLDVLISKGKNSKNIKNIESLWSKLPLSKKEKLATDAIENITKKLPLNFKNAIGNPRKLIDRIVKGSNGKFEWSTFWSNLKGIYYKAVFFQLLRELWKVTQTRSKQKSGYKVGYDGWVETLLNGRSYEEFIAGLIIPPVEWIASIMSWADKDTTYDEIREMLPPNYRDNFYRDESGSMFIEKAGIKYPVDIKDNQIGMVIDGVWYKFEDITF